MAQSSGGHPHVEQQSCHNGADKKPAERRSHHSEEMKGKLVARLNRIEGQIRGVKGMIEKDTYCDDVLNQIAAIQSALNGVGKLLLEGHMKSCIVERIQDGETEVLDELIVTINKLMK
ncbi:CsoR family transcriptional regulator [Paenibacillus yonginensis]|uniref:CsoR family transcriptional regulator n=1 Tax=Paenibacillus yonginensis TaxID=1462996 RepID=A0A1B1N5Q0_9BACL|nr:metal-sensitive transcriptional regulator [Paenibacillus yonginensis]ANS76744.1 CsoR family transcriptional regulator [Paenibacillus yonginensis]